MTEKYFITASLRRAYLRLAASSVRLGFLNARHTDAPIKKAIRAHHLDATRERRIGIMAALENPLKRSY